MTSLAAYVPWTTLRSVGNSHAVRLTVLIPLVGYLLIFNTYIVEQLALGKTFVDPATASSPIRRLLLTYFGLCSLAVGSVLYAWRCPQEIKHYPSTAAYTGGDGPHLSHFYLENIDTVLKGHDDETYKRVRSQLSGQGAETIRNAKLHMYFHWLDERHPQVRVVTAFFFGLGFLLLGLLSLQVFFRALGILWRSMT